jgi:hypothetical protein
VFSRVWPGPSRKYQTRFAGEDGRSAEDVFADATAPGAAEEPHDHDAPADADTAAHADGVSRDEPGPAPLDRDTAIDSWDELTRGDDPTR